MKKQAVLTIPFHLYEMEDVERLITASKVLDLTGEELLKKALDEFMSNRNIK